MVESLSQEWKIVSDEKQELSELKQLLPPVHASIKVNFGGKILELNYECLHRVPNDLWLFSLISGKYDHLLPKDENGLIFLDLDLKGIQPHANLLLDMKLWNGDAERRPELRTPEREYLAAFPEFSAIANHN